MVEINKTFSDYLGSFLTYLSYFMYFAAFTLFLFNYWKTRIGEEERFKTLIALFGSFSIFFTIYSFYLQNQQKLEQSKAESIKFYSDSFKDILDQTVKFFIDHPNMNYYYRELFANVSNYKEEDRDRVLEHQITTIIISRAGPIIRYIEDYKTNNKDNFYYRQVLVVESKFKDLLSSFFGSKIFSETYGKIKQGLASDVVRKYIQDNFKK